MKYCDFVLGNSSSGIIEAASFHKYAVDIGTRQSGRMTSGNIIHVNAESVSIVEACKRALSVGSYKGSNIYFKGGASTAIINVLKNANIGGI